MVRMGSLPVPSMRVRIRLRQVFLTRASRHAVASAELRGLIGQLGGDPAIRGKILSTTRRGWVTLPASLDAKQRRGPGR